MTDTRNAQFDLFVEPGEQLLLHIPVDAARTRCGLPMTGNGWRHWGLSYPREELAAAASGLVCRLCIGRLPVPVAYEPDEA